MEREEFCLQIITVNIYVDFRGEGRKGRELGSNNVLCFNDAKL